MVTPYMWIKTLILSYLFFAANSRQILELCFLQVHLYFWCAEHSEIQ